MIREEESKKIVQKIKEIKMQPLNALKSLVSKYSLTRIIQNFQLD